jgi:phosphonate transport system substrate-binding protein
MNIVSTRKVITAFTFMMIAVFAAACGGSSPTTPAPTAFFPNTTPRSNTPVGVSSKSTFVIGDVNSRPTASIELYQPFADYMAAHLKTNGIEKGAVKVAPDFQTMSDWLKTGEVDMILQTPYPAVLLQRAIGARLVLRRWRGGDPEYYTVIFARADQGLRSLKDLKGHMIAVQDEYSTSAYMLPLAYLIEAKLKPTAKPSPDSPVAPDEVGYTNSNSDDNTLQWVISGKIAAGATDNRSYEKIPEETRKQLVLLAQTEKIPRGVVVFSSAMDLYFADAVKAVLQQMDNNDEGKTVLNNLQSTTRFDELPGGEDDALARTKVLADLLKQLQAKK